MSHIKGRWSDFRIELYERASAWTGFHSKLFELIKKEIEENDTLLDVGCGTANLLQIIAEKHKMLLVDTDKNLMKYLSKKFEHNTNITLINDDINKIETDKKDIVLISFFENPKENEETIKRIFTYAKKKVIILTHTCPDEIVINSEKEEYKQKRGYDKDWDNFFSSGKYEYSRENHELDFGQPFKDIDEARTFINLFGTKKQTEERLKQIVHTKDNIFPLFLPKNKKFTIFVVHCG